jgi:hypothetical protein
LVLTAALIVGLAACGGPDRAGYVQANQQVFEQLPPFPGATLDTTTSSPVREEENGPVVGYVTRFDLVLPADATGETVSSFYRRELSPDWHLVETLVGPVLNFRRGGACVSINAESWRTHVLEVAVDHECS